jgi:hypothetical protein
MVPPQPVAIPRDASAKSTPESSYSVPELWRAQVAPPSPVARIVPIDPTAQPWTRSGKSTSSRKVLRSIPAAATRHAPGAGPGADVGVVGAIVVDVGAAVVVTGGTVVAGTVEVTAGAWVVTVVELTTEVVVVVGVKVAT